MNKNSCMSIEHSQYNRNNRWIRYTKNMFINESAELYGYPHNNGFLLNVLYEVDI